MIGKFAIPQRIALAIVGLIVAAAAVVWFTGVLSSGKRAQVEARLGAGRADAAMAAASDAANTVSSVASGAADADALTRENDHAIHSAPGAAAPVDPALDAAGRFGLCRRPAYRGSQQCLRFTPSPGLAPGR